MRKIHIIVFFMSLILPSINVSASSVWEARHSVFIDQLTIEKSITLLNKIYNLNIKIFGDVNNLPQGKFTLSLKDNTIEQAINKVLRKANIKNYALDFRRDKNILTVWILQNESGKDSSNWTKSNTKQLTGQDQLKTLTHEEFANLQQKASTEEFKTLTHEEFANLQQKASTEEFKTLTHEEFANLQQKASTEEFKTLTHEEFANLQQKQY